MKTRHMLIAAFFTGVVLSPPYMAENPLPKFVHISVPSAPAPAEGAAWGDGKPDVFDMSPPRVWGEGYDPNPPDPIDKLPPQEFIDPPTFQAPAPAPTKFWAPIRHIMDVPEWSSPRQVAAIPEPTTWVLMIAGVGLVGARLRWRYGHA